MDDPKMSLYRWTPKKEKAAIMLSSGDTINEVAASVGVSEKTIDRWKRDIEFSQEVDRLSLMVGVANRAERLRMAKRIVKKLAEKQNPTHQDLLEWLKILTSL